MDLTKTDKQYLETKVKNVLQAAAIEERAKEYLYRPARPLSYRGAIEQAYIDGATEQQAIDEDAMHAIVEEQVLKAIEKQKAIDIAKACEWLSGYMESLGYIDEWCRKGMDDFCKVMEE